MSVTIAPLIAVGVLGGPSAAVIAALIGTFEWREIKGLLPGSRGVPWYGTLFNHAETVIPAAAASVICVTWAHPFEPTAQSLVVVSLAGVSYFVINNAIAAVLTSVRDGRMGREAFLGNLRQFGVSLAGLAPLSWLMAAMYVVAGPIGIVPFAVPLYATRARLQEGRRDPRHVHPDRSRAWPARSTPRIPFTAGHTERVQLIAKDLGEELSCSEAELEALEWGGLLHDIGKIGIPDAILLKQGALDQEERMVMNAHPVKGEEIMRPVEKLEARAADHSPSPRVVQRLWLPRPPGWPRHPQAGAHHARRRLVRGDDRGPPVPHDAALRAARRSTSCTSSAASSSTRRWSRRSSA